MHCFEMRTANIDYFVGEDPLFGREEQDIQLPPAESGVGAHLAKSWETSIRQALMPVASNTSECSLMSQSSSWASIDSTQLVTVFQLIK